MKHSSLETSWPVIDSETIRSLSWIQWIHFLDVTSEQNTQKLFQCGPFSSLCICSEGALLKMFWNVLGAWGPLS